MLRTLDALRAEAVEQLCELIVPGSSRVGPVVYVDALLTGMPPPVREGALAAIDALAPAAAQGAEALAEHERTPEFGFVRALAIEAFCLRARKYLGAYMALLGGADAVLFGGGIGEHAPSIRKRICAGMQWSGLQLDARANAAATGVERCLSTTGTKPAVYRPRSSNLTGKIGFL